MAERKVLNKYIPPTFDPNRVQRGKPKGGGKPKKVRLMAPFSMQCSTCGNFIYKSKKFNARKEIVQGQDYLGIEIYRFYINCPVCAGEITFKTDPKNTDYEAEHGAVRNFEPWRDLAEINDQILLQRAKEEENNPLKALENRTLESKTEMGILDALDEIQTRNAMTERVDQQALLAKIHDLVEAYLISSRIIVDTVELDQHEHDAQIAKSVFLDADGEKVSRLLEPKSIADALNQKKRCLDSGSLEISAGIPLKKTVLDSASLGITLKKSSAKSVGISLKKPVLDSDSFKKPNPVMPASLPVPAFGLGLVAGYDSDSS